MSTKRLIIDIDEHKHRKLKGKLYSEGKTVKNFFEPLIDDYLEEKSEKHKESERKQQKQDDPFRKDVL